MEVTNMSLAQHENTQNNQYKPSENEEYMSEKQLQYFNVLLESWKNNLLKESKQTIEHFKEDNWQEPDVTDLATVEIDASLELKTRDRYRKLIEKIDQAFHRIKDGSYGYCEQTGEEIGIKRLEARPIATLCIEAQERHENYEKTHIDDKISG